MTNFSTESSTVDLIAADLKLPPHRVASAIELLEAGNTIPFVARYRKEATGGLDEIALRAIEDAMDRSKALNARKATVIRSIGSQGMLDEALRRQIEACSDLASLEDLYLPFKPKRQTRGKLARERGLQPLADQIIAGASRDVADDFIDRQRDVPDRDAAIAGALDIIAEQWSEMASTRRHLVDQAQRFGEISSKLKRGKSDHPQLEKFNQYLDRTERISRIPGHRVLAMFRGQSEGLLNITVQVDEHRIVRELTQRWVPKTRQPETGQPPSKHANVEHPWRRELKRTVQDCFERLLMPATQSAVLQTLKERAEEEAIEVFGQNLTELLMAPPAGPRVTMGIDPGFRTGCKLAVVDATGRFLEHATIYPTPPQSNVAAASRVVLQLVQTHAIELIAIGNGTASRETDAFVGELIRHHHLNVTKVMVSEAGASIYSASEVAAKEFPDLDVTIRGAISIARRLQDPLAELVKTDPKSIGVGQYQHDVNQTKLRRCLDRTVQSCVNRVGVDVNMASVPLLSYVAGIGPKLAENIVQHRDEQGRFDNRQSLTLVPKLGAKAFTQAAGFLRIHGGSQPLDQSAVHPESYPLVNKMAQHLSVDVRSLVGNASVGERLNPADFVDGTFGLPTVTDILDELAKPGRDPRRQFKVAAFDDAVNSLDDLRPGLVLEGVITNVTHFGAFTDIGVHQDGLIHVSQLADHFVDDPTKVVAVGDVVKVRVLEVDVTRKRISLTRNLQGSPGSTQR